VTEENVWLGGNVDGINTKTVAYWKGRRGKGGNLGRPACDVITDYARDFMENGNTIIAAIDDLIAFVSE